MPEQPTPDVASTAPRTQDVLGPDVLPVLAGDLYGYEQMLDLEDQRVLADLRSWLQRRVAPTANEQWEKAEFPHHLVPELAELGVIGIGYDQPGRPAKSRLLTSFVTLELSRVDTSWATFFGVHSGLAMGSIVLLGVSRLSAAQVRTVAGVQVGTPLARVDLAGSARTSSASAGCRTCSRDGRSARSRSPSLGAAPTSRSALTPPPGARARSGCSTARSAGSATRPSPTW